MEKLKAAMLYKPCDLRVVDIRKPKIGGFDALIKVVLTGVCATDILTYKGLGPYVKLPIIPGHEFSGLVTKVGNKVRNVQLGDRIIAEPSWGCESCSLCRTGRSNLCEKGVHVGRDINGSFAQFIRIPAKQLYRLPENVSFKEAQSAITIASAVRAVRLSEVGMGDYVAVLGPGHAGLILLQVAKAAGAGQVIVTGTRENRLKLAKDLGAALTVNVTREDAVKAVKDVTNGLGADVVIEATGNPAAVRQAIDMVTPGGTIVLFGLVEKALEHFQALKIYVKELRILGCRGGLCEYEMATKFLSEGKVRVNSLITHELPLEETEKALEIADKRIGEAIRVLVKT